MKKTVMHLLLAVNDEKDYFRNANKKVADGMVDQIANAKGILKETTDTTIETFSAGEVGKRFALRPQESRNQPAPQRIWNSSLKTLMKAVERFGIDK